MGFSRQEYWSGLPFPSPGDLPDSGIEPGSSASQGGALSSEPPGMQRAGHHLATKLGGSDGKESACNAGDPGLIPESGRSPGEEIGYLLQYSCLDNSMDRGSW